MSIFTRLFADTPGFFRKVRNLGLTIAGVGGAILAIPATAGVALPAIVMTIATHLVAAGTVASVVAQSVYKTDPDAYPDKNNK